MNTITVHNEGKEIYRILLTENFSSLAQAAGDAGMSGCRLCIVSDANTAPLYLDEVSQLFKSAGYPVFTFVFPAGEQNKNLNVVMDLYEQLVLNHFERGDVLVALGGGVVGDLTGFAAATFLRGIRFIQVPTTLLSQVDSSIGGKTGVDFRAYKNMVGAFHMPSLVYSSVATLQTLPERIYREGMGEIIKHGLIRDRAYYELLKEKYEDVLRRDPDTMLSIISRSCQIKREVVENDPHEKNIRALLNFGHTIGHAVEKLMNFKMYHGECVAVGMAAASWLSFKRGMISEEDYQDIIDTIRSYDLPVAVHGLYAEDILRTTKSDKKVENGHVKFILLEGIGNAVVCHDVTDEEILAAAGEILH